MDEKPSKPKRVGNHYIPPPARKQGTEPPDVARMKERPTKLSGTRQEKLCDDSSLLFKDSSPKLEEQTKAKWKIKRSNKKANAENTSIAAESLPVLPTEGFSDRGIHSLVHETCDGSDKLLVKSHFPLNDLENTRSRESSVNNTDAPVKLVEGPEHRRRVIPSYAEPRRGDEIKANVTNWAELKADVDDAVERVSGDVPRSPETKHSMMNGVAEPPGRDDLVSQENELATHFDLAPKEKSPSCDLSNSVDLPTKHNGSDVGTSAVSRGYVDPSAKTRAPSDGCLDFISVNDGDWDSIYDDCGECLVPKNSTSSPKDSRLQVENDLAKMKLSSKQPVPEKTYENCSSIIEIYGFSEELKTNDLMSVFGSFINRGFNLKWVDNTHALGIFPSPFLAEEALASNLPLVKTRPIAQGTPLSQERARTLVLPSSLRPKTCSALARRLVSGALGLRVKATPEERAAERELLREAREKKKMVLKQRDAAWEGNFSSHGCEEKEAK